MPIHTTSSVHFTLPVEDEVVSESVAAVDRVDQLARVVERLAEQVEKMQ